MDVTQDRDGRGSRRIFMRSSANAVETNGKKNKANNESRNNGKQLLIHEGATIRESGSKVTSTATSSPERSPTRP
ncbi:MAG: hypothetical protein M1830_005883, partial [Pleopsidium flavum]